MAKDRRSGSAQKTINDALQADRIAITAVLRLGARELVYEAVTALRRLSICFK